MKPIDYKMLRYIWLNDAPWTTRNDRAWCRFYERYTLEPQLVIEEQREREQELAADSDCPALKWVFLKKVGYRRQEEAVLSGRLK